jgi:nucleoside-diphosphate-sugar epimerase
VLRDEKILVTGAAGQVALPLVESLAGENEVWGVARFSKPALRARHHPLGPLRLQPHPLR